MTPTSKFLLRIGVAVVLLGAGVAVWFGGLNHTYEGTVYSHRYAVYVAQYAKQYNLEEDLVYAVIKTESGFDPEAVSEDEARGLMQVTEETFDWISNQLGYTKYVHKDLHDPALGIEYGCFLLGYLKEKFGETEVMLAAYHAGMNITAKWLEDASYSANGTTLDEVPYADTAHYINKVMKNYQAYQRVDEK